MSQTIAERLMDDLKAAMKAGEEDRKRTLRGLRAAVKNAEIDAQAAGKLEKGGQLDDEALTAVLQKQAKQRRDAIEQFEAGGRSDLAASERLELGFIEAYLPAQMEEAEIEAVAREVIEDKGASGLSDMGQVMGPLMQALAGRADGKLASAVVRRLLSQ